MDSRVRGNDELSNPTGAHMSQHAVALERRIAADLSHHDTARRAAVLRQYGGHALSFCTLLPGPEAQQQSIYIGWLLNGVRGGLVAGVLFVLPGLAALLALWWLALRRSLATRTTTGRRRSAGLGVLGLTRTGATGAIAGRSLVLWFRDPRLVIQLAILPVMPSLLVLLAVIDRVDWFAYLAAPLAAGLLPLTQFAGISYDGPAFASELAAAVRGRGRWRRSSTSRRPGRSPSSGS